jgi:hypothetical protein
LCHIAINVLGTARFKLLRKNCLASSLQSFIINRDKDKPEEPRLVAAHCGSMNDLHPLDCATFLLADAMRGYALFKEANKIARFAWSSFPDYKNP